MTSVSQKQCCRCGLTKPAADFNKDRKTSSGLSPQCRACRSEIRRENADKIAAYNAEYQAGLRRPRPIGPRACRVCGTTDETFSTKENICLACRREKRRENQEHINRLRREKRQRDRLAPEVYACRSCGDEFTLRGRQQHTDCKPCRDRARKSAYWRTPKGRAARRGINHRRRIRTESGDCGCVTVIDILYLQTLPCTYCGAPFQHLDHVVPVSKGGMHCLSNLTPACESCNLRKSDTVLDDPPPAILTCTRSPEN